MKLLNTNTSWVVVNINYLLQLKCDEMMTTNSYFSLYTTEEFLSHHFHIYEIDDAYVCLHRKNVDICCIVQSTNGFTVVWYPLILWVFLSFLLYSILGSCILHGVFDSVVSLSWWPRCYSIVHFNQFPFLHCRWCAIHNINCDWLHHITLVMTLFRNWFSFEQMTSTCFNRRKVQQSTKNKPQETDRSWMKKIETRP